MEIASRAEIVSALNQVERETESFAQAFSNKGSASGLCKGSALDPPETLSLDSARALPLTRWDSVPDPAKGRSPFEPEFRCRSQARSLCTDGTVCFRWVEKSKTMPFLFQSQPSKDGEEGAKIDNEEEKKGEGKEIQRGKP